MAGRIDEIEVVDLPVFGFVLQRSGLSLDGYPTLFFDIHRVKNLCFHLTCFEPSAALDQSICESGFAVINVRNDRKISDVIHQRERLSG